jgi:hypothetical protein
MSDFGTLLLTAKKSKASFRDAEREAFSSKLQSIVEDNDFEDAAGRPFTTDAMIEEGNEEYPPHLLVRLSEHYFGNDDDHDESMEFVEDVEFDYVDDLIDSLSEEFPDYTFKKLLVEW